MQSQLKKAKEANQEPEPNKPIPSKSEPINPWILGIILVVAVGVLWLLNKPKTKPTQTQEIKKALIYNFTPTSKN